PLRLPVGRCYGTGVEMVPRDHDRSAQLAGGHHAVDRSSELGSLSVSEPAYPGRQAFPGEELLGETDPAGQGLVVWELAQHDAVRLDDVVRVSRHRDPAERTPAFGEQRADVEGDKPLERERVCDARLLRLSADVVPVIKDHASGPEEIEHGPDVNRDRLRDRCTYSCGSRVRSSAAVSTVSPFGI